MKKIIVIIIFFTLMVVNPVQAEQVVWDSTLNCFNNHSFEHNEYCFKKGFLQYYGLDAKIIGQRFYQLASPFDGQNYIKQHFNLSDQSRGKMVIYISKTYTENPRVGTITGKPYLWCGSRGELNGESYSVYYQGAEMINLSGEGGWILNYGVFDMPQGLHTLEFMMSQGLRKGEEYDGTRVWFKDPGVYLVDHYGQVQEIINEYTESIKNEVPPQTLNTELYQRPVPFGAHYKFPPVKNYYLNVDKNKRIYTDRVAPEDMIGALVKGETDPATYIVDFDGKLRWVKYEHVAERLFGVSWNDFITWFSDSIIYTYDFGEPIEI